jgi:hypothetical protein
MSASWHNAYLSLMPFGSVELTASIIERRKRLYSSSTMSTMDPYYKLLQYNIFTNPFRSSPEVPLVMERHSRI